MMIVRSVRQPLRPRRHDNRNHHRHRHHHHHHHRHHRLTHDRHLDDVTSGAEQFVQRTNGMRWVCSWMPYRRSEVTGEYEMYQSGDPTPDPRCAFSCRSESEGLIVALMPLERQRQTFLGRPTGLRSGGGGRWRIRSASSL